MKILVTQPRRVAAVSLAKRVASERHENLGMTVGYCIGQEKVVSDNTCLFFVTTGWLLQKLVGDPGFFFSCSHIVLDEVHERDLDSDMLALVVKRLLHYGNACSCVKGSSNAVVQR